MLVALDCANVQRIGAAAALIGEAPLSLDIDHHHDNTAFGEINLLVADASSTGEIVRDILRELDVDLTPAIAEALYVALVMDTGRFQYANTTPKALRLAAELVEAGVDVHRVFQGIFESVEFAKLKLLARALERAEIFDGGRLVISYLVRTDFQELGVGEEYAEGIIDYLRAVDGADMAAVIREPPEPPDAKRRVACAPRATSSTCRRSRASEGGGGHRQAAGFSSDESVEEISSSSATRSRPCRHGRLGRPASSSSTSRPGRPRSPWSRELRSRTGARAGHAGTLDPFASGLLLVLLGSATRLAQCLVGLDKRYVTEIDLARADDDRRSRGRGRRRAEPPAPDELERAARRLRGEIELPVPRASAVKIDGERAYRLARRGEQVEMPVRALDASTRSTLSRYDDGVATLDLPCRARHVRARDRGRARRPLPDAPAYRGRAVQVVGRRRGADPARRRTRCRSCLRSSVTDDEADAIRTGGSASKSHVRALPRASSSRSDGR